MERAHKAINEAGAFFSVDVFGYVAWEPQPNIGQNLQVMGQHADYVYPMVYPSHFLYDELGLGNPAAGLDLLQRHVAHPGAVAERLAHRAGGIRFELRHAGHHHDVEWRSKRVPGSVPHTLSDRAAICITQIT